MFLSPDFLFFLILDLQGGFQMLQRKALIFCTPNMRIVESFSIECQLLKCVVSVGKGISQISKIFYVVIDFSLSNYPLTLLFSSQSVKCNGSPDYWALVPGNILPKLQFYNIPVSKNESSSKKDEKTMPFPGVFISLFFFFSQLLIHGPC